MEKKISKKMIFRLFSGTAKSPLFFAMSFAAIFFMIYADSIVSKVTLYPLDLTSYEIFELQDDIGIQDTEQILLPFFGDSLSNTSSQTPEEIAVEEDPEDLDDDRDVIVPPTNATRDERINWFRRRLSESEILESNDLTRKFHARVLEFLNHQCTIQLYMTWFAPAKTFGIYQFLTLETLFKSHPKGCLIILSRTMDTKRGYRLLKPLIDRGFKILAIAPDVSFLLKNTPAESWLEAMKNGEKDPGSIPFTPNLSNLLRIAVLYKYGGAYLDMDYVVMRDFHDLKNAIGVQSIDSKTKKWTRLNNAAMIFDINHPILYDFMEEFAWNFNGNRWGYNGPYLVSRVVERVMTNPGYDNLTMLPPKAFYPVNWVEIHRLIREPKSESESIWVENMVNELSDGETYGLHLWYSKIKDKEIEQGSVLAKLIAQLCVVCVDLNTFNKGY